MTNIDMIELFLLSQASGYDCTIAEERERSVRELEFLFYDIQDLICPDLTIEVGAFSARFSIEMKRRGIEATALEANKSVFEHFAFVSPLFNSGVEYLNKAVSSRVGETKLKIQKVVNEEPVGPFRGNNSLLFRNESAIEYDEAAVEAVTVDSIISGRSNQCLSFSLYIDAEGSAGEVLSGCTSTLTRCSSIFIEVEELEFWRGQWKDRQVLDFLSVYGFMPVARDFRLDGQYNVIFLKCDLVQNPAIKRLLALHLSRTRIRV